MKHFLLAVSVGLALLVAVAVLESGCSTSTLHKSNSDDVAALQGTWKGSIRNEGQMSACTFVISGKTFEFHDADTNIWYSGNFSLREVAAPKQFIATIVDCPNQQYIGKVGMCIYKIENGMLTLAGNEPGNPVAPERFDDPHAACLEVGKQ